MAAPGEATAAEMPGASTNTGGSGGYEPDTTASRENVYLLSYSFNQDPGLLLLQSTAQKTWKTNWLRLLKMKSSLKDEVRTRKNF